MPREIETLYLILNYLRDHPDAPTEQVDKYIAQTIARIKDPVEAARQEGAESEERARRLFQNFEEIYHVEPGNTKDDYVGIDLWVSCHILRYSESGYEVDDRRIPAQVKSSGAGVDVARQHMEDHGDYRFVINVGIEREDDEILTEIQGRFENELGISLTHIQ